MPGVGVLSVNYVAMLLGVGRLLAGVTGQLGHLFLHQEVSLCLFTWS